jgi:ABC-type Fe3+/spermidine/putrescine transport system ATPase subunit
MSIRPEHVRVARAGDPATQGASAGTVRGVSYLGAQSLLRVELRSRRIVMAAVSASAGGTADVPREGEAVDVSWPSDACVLLDS